MLSFVAPINVGESGNVMGALASRNFSGVLVLTSNADIADNAFTIEKKFHRALKKMPSFRDRKIFPIYSEPQFS